MRRAKTDGGKKKTVVSESPHPEWSQLLIDAVSKPGMVSSAYSRFWNYSVGNQLLALWQCMMRSLDPGPINTFVGWKELGRHVRKGERAITLCMPVSIKRRKAENPSDSSDAAVAERPQPEANAASGTAPAGKEPITVTVFTYKPHWFLLSQTDGKEYVPTVLPDWSEQTALEVLKIDRVPFSHTNGNCQGFARSRSVAVSPVAAHPHRTLMHEIAHIVLGHTAEHTGQLDDHELTPRNVREVEAESVALIVCESLKLPGAEFARGYIQHWLAGQTIPERSAQKIFKAADQILKAGYPSDAPAPACEASDSSTPSVMADSRATSAP